MKSILNAELYQLPKTSKTDLFKISKRKKEDTHSDSHLSFDRTQLSLCNCPILRVHTGDKPYETQKVYEWFHSIVMILCYLIKIDVGEKKRQGFIFYDTSHKQK